MQTMTRESSWRIYTLLLGISALLVLSFYSLDLQLHRLFSERSWTLMSRFFGELLSPNLDPSFLQKVLVASLETIAMSALGTLIAGILGIFFCFISEPDA